MTADRLAAFRPDTGLVLGSGLGSFTDRLEIADRIPFAAAALPVSAADESGECSASSTPRRVQSRSSPVGFTLSTSPPSNST